MTLVRLETAAPQSRVKHSTTEPLRSLISGNISYINLSDEKGKKCFIIYSGLYSESVDPDQSSTYSEF